MAWLVALIIALFAVAAYSVLYVLAASFTDGQPDYAAINAASAAFVASVLSAIGLTIWAVIKGL